LSWWLYPFNYIADDSLFYLVVVRNIVLTGQQTFSGIYPTNGVHPLWLYCLALYGYLCSWIDPTLLWNIRFAIPLSALFALWGAWNLSRVAERWNLSRLLVADFPLVFVMVFGVLYSEGHVLFAMLAWLIRVSTSDVDTLARKGLRVGLLGGLLFLASLDSMFLVAIYGLWYVWQVRRLRSVVLFTFGVAVLAVPYVVSNWLFLGHQRPSPVG